MSKLNFARPNKGGILHHLDKDVRVFYTKRTSQGKPNDTCRLVFNQGIADLISDTGYLTIAVEDNNMYFLGVERKDGWKISKQSRGFTSQVQITFNCLSDEIKNFVRISNEMDFDLMFDEDYGLYYIGHPKLNFAGKRGPGRPKK